MSLFKLKTTEYFIFRKLREFLKQNYEKKIVNKMQKFKLEVEDLSKYYKPPKPLDYYYSIASEAFNEVDTNK